MQDLLHWRKPTQNIYKQASLIVNGSSSTSLPEGVEFTEELLERIYQSRHMSMVMDSYKTIRKNLLVGSWHDVEKLTKEQGAIVLRCLARHEFTENRCFNENINYYKRLKVIRNDFNDKQILYQQRMGARTIHALIGIYMKLVPVNLGVFTMRLNSSSPWSTEGVDALHDADSSGVTRSVAFSVDPAHMNIIDVSTVPASAAGFPATE